MDPIVFLFVIIAFFMVITVGPALDDHFSEAAAWKSQNRFVVRQIEDGLKREWICARYIVSTGKISFRQEGHKHSTVVAGHWHVEPVAG